MIKNPISINTLPNNAQPSSLTYIVNFALGNPFIINLTQDIETKQISKAVQTIWIDNSTNSDAVSITIPSTNQTIVCPANYQGAYPFIISPQGADNISVSSTSTTAIVTIILMDMPMDFMAYNSLGSSVAAGTQNVEVVNPVATPVQSLVVNTTSNIVPTISYRIANNGTGTGYETNETYALYTASAQLTAAAEVVMIPASTAGDTFYLDGITLGLTAEATLATAGEDVITVYDGTTAIFTYNLYIPATAAATGSYIPFTIPTKYNSLTGNSSCSVGLGTALATGALNVVVNYGYNLL